MTAYTKVSAVEDGIAYREVNSSCTLRSPTSTAVDLIEGGPRPPPRYEIGVCEPVYLRSQVEEDLSRPPTRCRGSLRRMSTGHSILLEAGLRCVHPTTDEKLLKLLSVLPRPVASGITLLTVQAAI